jgi:hypothetical protein
MKSDVDFESNVADNKQTSPICNQALLEPLRKYHRFYDEVTNKSLEETTNLLALLANESIKLDHVITKDIHDVLIDLKLANPETNSCVISFDELTEENKSEFTIVLDGQVINFYKIDQLQQTFNSKLEWPHNRRQPSFAEMSYLNKMFGVTFAPFVADVVADEPHALRNVRLDEDRSPGSPFIILVLCAASVYFGWIWWCLPVTMLYDTVMGFRSSDARSTEEKRKELIFCATLFLSSVVIFCTLMGTGIAQGWAEDFKESFFGRKRWNTTYFAGSIASSVSVLTPVVLCALFDLSFKLCRRLELYFASVQSERLPLLTWRAPVGSATNSQLPHSGPPHRSIN